MMDSAHFSNNALIIHGEVKPYQGWVVGYVAIIAKLKLQMPYPR